MQPSLMPRPVKNPDDKPSAAAKARFWDRVARKYAADPIADLAGYEATLRRVQSLLSPHHCVLEIGCGTGSTALRLAAFTRRMLATDVSPEMIAIAREKLALQPGLQSQSLSLSQSPSQLRFGVADAETAAHGCACHDVVLAFNVLHLVSDLDLALKAIIDTLKPGGLFISKTPCLAEMNPLVTRLFVPLMRAIGKAPDLLSFDAMQLQSTFQRHGLQIEAVERHGTKRKDMRVFIVARRPG